MNILEKLATLGTGNITKTNTMKKHNTKQYPKEISIIKKPGGEPRCSWWTQVFVVNPGARDEPRCSRWTQVLAVNPGARGKPGCSRWSQVITVNPGARDEPRCSRWTQMLAVNPGAHGEPRCSRWTHVLVKCKHVLFRIKHPSCYYS
jgi:predicted phosphodiesterase